MDIEFQQNQDKKLCENHKKLFRKYGKQRAEIIIKRINEEDFMSEKNYNPDYAIHPGNTLKDTLEALNMNQVELAERINLTPKHINEIVKGKSAVTPETAIKLSAVFGISATFWNNLQKKYDETCARLNLEENLEREQTILSRFTCYVELAKWGYVPKASSAKDKALNLHKFFGVSSLDLVANIQSVAFRQAKKKNLNKESLAAWLRCGELEAKKIEVKEFNRELLRNSIEQLRALTREGPKVFSKSLVEICSAFGAAVVFVPYFKNTHVCGAARWINDKPIIQLSLRGKHADIFWFTFFHELGHIFKHGKKEQFVDLEKGFSRIDEEKEKEADEFAQSTLIPKNEYIKFKSNLANITSAKAIRAFAESINISPAIVAGRLSYDYRNWKTWAGLRGDRLKFVEDEGKN